MTKVWKTPGGSVPAICLNMLRQPHLLVAGSTGSGKSVLINSLMYTVLYQSPASVKFILIDPKRVELNTYADLPHVIRYASEPPEMVAALRLAVDIMEERFQEMQRARTKEHDGAHIYVIIDEFADLMTTLKKQTLPQLQRLAQLGRAARVHLIAATQRPTKDIVNGQIKVNMDSRVALRCPTAQDSRNIINVKGAETLPRYGYGYYLTPETMQPQLIQIPLTPEKDIETLLKWWKNQCGLTYRLFKKTPY
ncbi:MAG: DNA translocase FtsK [Clostridia bacterium]|nr:DNA translocase FtsK [Clostridia bacterium]